jgi:hypothetical protein
MVQYGEDLFKDGVLSRGRELKISLELVVWREGLWHMLCGEWSDSRTYHNRECMVFSMDRLIVERSTGLKYPHLPLRVGNIHRPFTPIDGIGEITDLHTMFC